MSAIRNSNWRTGLSPPVIWEVWGILATIQHHFIQPEYLFMHSQNSNAKCSIQQASISKLLPVELCAWNKKNRACFSVSVFLTSQEINSPSPFYLSDFVQSVTSDTSLNMPHIFPLPLFWSHPPSYVTLLLKKPSKWSPCFYSGSPYNWHSTEQPK